MKVELEDLPNDGARYRCGYGIDHAGEEWRCNQEATQAPVTLPDPAKLEVFYCRALCATHLRLLGLKE